jgi:hypothetical protein
VGGGVSLQMSVTVVQGNQLIKGRDDVSWNIGIGVFIDRHGGGGVGNKNMADPAFDTTFP